MSDQRPERDADLEFDLDTGADDEPEPWVAGLEPDEGPAPDAPTADEPIFAEPASDEPTSDDPASEAPAAEDGAFGTASVDEPTPWQVAQDDDDPAPWSSSAWAGPADTSTADEADDGDVPAVDSGPERLELSDLGDDFDLAALEAAVVEMGIADDDEELTGAGTGPDDRTGEPAPRTALGEELTEPIEHRAAPGDDEERWDETGAPPADDGSHAGAGRVDLTNFTAKGGSGTAGGGGKGRRRLFGR